MRDDAQKEIHKHHMVGQEEGASDADGESSEDEDWNTAEGTYVTMDGDILPTPESFANKTLNKVKRAEVLDESSSRMSKDEHRALAASKKELSD